MLPTQSRAGFRTRTHAELAEHALRVMPCSVGADAESPRHGRVRAALGEQERDLDFASCQSIVALQLCESRVGWLWKGALLVIGRFVAAAKPSSVRLHLVHRGAEPGHEC